MEQRTNTFKKIDTVIYERWFHRIVSHWHLFAICILLGLGGAYLYLRYTPIVYSVAATVLLRDASQNINPFEQSRNEYSFSRSVNLSNDIKVFTSRRLIEETIKNIDWKVSYFIEGNVKNTEVYRFQDFKLEFPDSNNNIPYNNPINLRIISPQSFQLDFREKGPANIKFRGAYNFNTNYTINGFAFQVKTSSGTLESGSVFIIELNSKEKIINEFSSKLRVAQIDKASSVLMISGNGTCIEKEKDFVNNHCNSFVKISLNDKNATHERTINFIDNQLDIISDTLSGLETIMVRYRKKFNSSNMESLAEKRFDKLDKLEDERAKYELNKRYFNYLKDYLNRKQDYSDVVAPTNIGMNDPILNDLIGQLMTLKLKQNATFKTENNQSPFKIDNENKINQIKKSIYELIINIENSNTILTEDMNKRINLITRLTSNILDNERNYVELKRKYKINEELYNMLLKKKSEMSIIRAGNVSDTKIVDFANISGVPYPNITKVYITNLLIALLIPLGYILFKYLTNYKIMEKDDVTTVCEMPFLGAIGHITDEERMVIIKKPKSGLAESFRSIRANLYFFMSKPEQKVILITSSLSGEGKTFSSLNIASVLAVSGRKVLLIGADMRKPRVYLDINIRNVEGLSNYLVNTIEADKMILETSVENLYFINSGSVPPNPAELLSSPKLNDLFKKLRAEFDYIVIDTPPIGLVTDAFNLMKFSDLNIYIIRHNFTQTRFLKDLNEMVQTGLIKNIVYILNDFNISKNYGYGYRYGYDSGGYGFGSRYGSYGYYDDDEVKKGFVAKLKNFFKKKKSIDVS